jgi:hypothetical protein
LEEKKLSAMRRRYKAKVKPKTFVKEVHNVRVFFILTLKKETDDDLLILARDLIDTKYSSACVSTHHLFPNISHQLWHRDDQLNVFFWNPTRPLFVQYCHSLFHGAVFVLDETIIEPCFPGTQNLSKKILEQIQWAFPTSEFFKDSARAIKKYGKTGHCLLLRFGKENPVETFNFIPMQKTRIKILKEALKCFYICCRRRLGRDISSYITKLIWNDSNYRQTWSMPVDFKKPVELFFNPI